MFDVDIFAEQMLLSQQQGALTDYCLKHWEDGLDLFPNANNDMDELVEMASGVNVIKQARSFEINNEPILKYWQFVESLKASAS